MSNYVDGILIFDEVWYDDVLIIKACKDKLLQVLKKCLGEL